jgi:tetratricopeptide (TPR) repeat protein
MRKWIFALFVPIIFAMIITGCEHRLVPVNQDKEKPKPKQDSSSSLQADKPSDSMEFSASHGEHLRWLLKTFGLLSAAESPLVTRVENVFERVLAAADRRGNRLPRLLVIRKAGDPWVMCLADGTVVITQKAMEICYQDADENTGDARAAFILGHELAHLANDDFWNLAVSQAFQRFGPANASQNLYALLNKSEDMETRRKKELQADDYGMLYAAMAGYDPKVIADMKGKNFFREWTSRTGGDIAYSDETHPDADDRALFLLSKMNAVKDDLILFDLGVRLYQLGMYKDALGFLEAFQRKFPCREVFSNVGMVHFQLAMNELSRSSSIRVYRHKLSTVFDTETRAKTFRGGSGAFEDSMRAAIRAFRDACEKDLSYLPARVNLSSALIMTAEYSQAIAVLDEALKLRGDDPAVLNNRAVAFYLSYEKKRELMKAVISEESVEVLKSVIEKNPEFSDAYYNLGRIRSELGEESAARDVWEKFLRIEPAGGYAQAAAKSLGKEIKDQTLPPKIFGESPPVRLGGFDTRIEEQLKSLSAHRLELENVSGEYYFGENFRVLVLENEVELVESSVRQKMSREDMISKYGDPVRIFSDISGKKVLVYEKFAVDIENNTAVRVVYFDKELGSEK